MKLAEMITFLHNRVPYVRDTIAGFASEAWLRMLQMLASDREAFGRAFREAHKGTSEPEPPEEEMEMARQWMLSGGARVSLSQTGALQSMFSTVDVIRDGLLQMNWSYLVVPKGRTFITSDVPMSWIDPTPRPAFFSGSGLCMKNVEVSFPICPNVCFLAMWSDSVKTGPAASETVDQMNLRRGMWASSLYGSEKEEIEQVVQIVRTVRSQSPL